MLEVQDQSQAGINAPLCRCIDAPSALYEVGSVERDELRGIRHRVLRQSGQLAWHEHIARGLEQAKVARQHHGDDGLDAAAIEGIGLNDEYRSAEPGGGTAGLAQLSPPDSAPLYHQVSGRMARRWARRTAGSRSLDSRPYTASSCAVTLRP